MSDKVGWDPLEPGMYILDKEFHGGYQVEVLSCGRMFATVKDLETGQVWQTMVNRLSEVEK